MWNTMDSFFDAIILMISTNYSIIVRCSIKLSSFDCIVKVNGRIDQVSSCVSSCWHNYLTRCIDPMKGLTLMSVMKNDISAAHLLHRSGVEMVNYLDIEPRRLAYLSDVKQRPDTKTIKDRSWRQTIGIPSIPLLQRSLSESFRAVF